MTMVSSFDVGAIAMTPYNFAATWSSTSGVKGFRTASFSGVVTIAQAKQLSELVANPAARVTKGGVSGVQEFLASSSTVLASFNGYYLLTAADFLPDRIDAGARFAGFTLQGVLIGDLP